MMKQTVFKPSKMRYCHECGSQLNEGVKFCPYCGIEQTKKKREKTQEDQVNSGQSTGYTPRNPQGEQKPKSETGFETLSSKITGFVNAVSDRVRIGLERAQQKIEQKNKEIRIKNEERLRREKQKAKIRAQKQNHTKASSSSLKKPKPPMSNTEYIIGPIISILIWVAYLYQTALGTHDILGPQFLRWMDVAATFALYAAIINLFRGLFGKEHYNVQSVLIIAHTVLGLVFIQYILVFEQAFLSIPVLERIPASDYRDLVKAVEIVPKIVVALVILGFFHSLYEAFTIRARYLKYEKELKKFEQYK